MQLSRTDTRPSPIRLLAMAFNPKGVLPGRGARELQVSLSDPATGPVHVERAQLGASFQTPLPVRRHRWSLGDPTSPRLQGAIDALDGALAHLLPALAVAPSQENDVDNGYGWAKGNSYALRTGGAGIIGTRYFYGLLDGHLHPDVDRAVALLGDLAEALRADA